jgi:uncharacterized membrane protein YgcG
VRTGGKKPKRSFAARHGAALAAGFTALVLLVVFTAFVPRQPLGDGPPPPGHWFDDRGGMVSTSFASAKSTYLQSYVLQALHLAVLVVVEPAVPPGGVEQYATDAASRWKIGAQGADNGVVLFVFPSERAARLQVGYGLEGVIPDIEAKRLLEATLVPKFSAGRYEEGFDDFLAALVKRLQENAAESVKADKLIGIVSYAMGVVRQVPRLAGVGWNTFKKADLEARVIMTIFAAVLAAAFGYGLSGVAIGVGALVQLPWRLAHGESWRALDRKKLAAEFAPAAFVRRPPPSVVALAGELRLGELVQGAIAAAGIIVAIAFLGLGLETVMEGHGNFSGAGVTVEWPAPDR